MLFLKIPALVLSVFLAHCISGHTQNLLLYEVEGSPSSAGTGKEYFADSLSRELFLKELLASLHGGAYPFASIQSKTYSGDTLKVKMESGAAFTWLSLRRGNLEERLAEHAGFLAAEFQQRQFDLGNLKDLFNKVLDEAQNIGYPFAAIRLDSLVQEGSGISAAIDFQYGPYITFDSLDISGNSRTKSAYLSRLLRIPPGSAFSQKKVDRSLGLVQKLPYIQLVGEPQLTFQNQSAKLSLPINDRRINTLDGIIGILPNEQGDNKLLVTGQFDLSLYNVAGRGRNYHLQWQRLSEYSQNLSVSAEEPMLLGSLFDLRVSFDLIKQDTSFLNRDFRVDMGYRASHELYLGFFSRRQAGDLLSVPAVEDQRLPEVADFRLNNYGMNLIWDDLDNILFPRRGWFSDLEFGIGNKRLLQNTGLPVSNYEGVEMNSVQYYLTFSMERHLLFSSGLGALVRMRAGEMANKNLFLNDLFRLGGLQSIRGFNENFFFAKRYVYANFEPRFYFDTYSYFLLFLDAATLQGIGGKGNLDRPFAFGGGVSLASGEGVFNFIYALGKSNTQLLGFNFSKIHFGYTGRF